MASSETNEPLELGLSRHARGKRRRRRFLLFAIPAIVSIAAALPTIVAHTPLRDEVLARALPAGAGSVTSESASLGWTGYQTLKNVRWLDVNGKPLFTAESISVDKSLTSLLTNRRNLGTIKVTRPAIYLETTPQGSNWETAIARLQTKQPADPSQNVTLDPQPVAVNVNVEIVDGGLAAHDVTTGEKWNLHGLDLAARADANEGTWTADGTTNVQMVSPDAALASQPGQVEFHVKSLGQGKQTLQVVSRGLPLEPLQPWLSRMAPGIRLQGDAASDINVDWQLPTANDAAGVAVLRAIGRVDFANAKFTTEALSGDVLQLQQATVNTKLAVAGERIVVESMQAEGDWFKANVQGAFNINELRQISLDALPTEPAIVDGTFDLVSLTKQLPRTLQIRPDVEVDSGVVRLTARSLAGNGQRSWDVAAEVRDLRGTDGEREIRWDDPVKAYIELIEGSTKPEAARLNTVSFQSPFASAKLDAVAEGANGEFQFNLAQLSDQLGQFVDLSAWQLSGTGGGTMTFRETGQTGFLATLLADMEEVDVRREGQIVWADKRLHVDVQTSGQHENLKLRQLAGAALTMQGASDVFSIELTSPMFYDTLISESPQKGSWHVKGRGPLTRWAGRLRPWVAGIPEEINGATTLDAQVIIADGLLSVSNVKLEVEDLRGNWGDVRFEEPMAKLVGDFRWQAATKAIESRQLELTSSTVALRTRDLAIQLAEGSAPVAHGEIAYTADLERLANWLALTGEEQTWPRGQAGGSILLNSNAQVAAADITCKAKKLDLVAIEQAAGAGYGKPKVLWSEPQLELAGRVSYEQAIDRLKISNLKVVGQTLQAEGIATLDEATTSKQLQGDLTLAYDAAAVEKLVVEYLGPGAKLSGANRSRVQFTGLLNPPVDNAAGAAPVDWSQRWQIIGNTGWQAADFYGLPFGPAQLQANLRDGQLLFQPIDLSVGQGRFTAQPRLVLDPSPRFVQLSRGPLIENVAISEQVSESLLKYAAPILVGAARTEGEFSLELDGARIPIDTPEKTDLGGRLTVHRLAILPGPSTKPMIDLLRQIGMLARGEVPGGNVPAGNGIRMQEQPIDIRVVDGKVYHREMQFIVDDVPVKSTGWVGFDEQLHLDLEVPVQEKWVRGSKYFRSLAGQKLRIPVRGTLTKWKIDDRVVGQLIQSAAGQVIGDEVNRQLEKLFRGR